jgi:hypothetical protein
LPAEGRDARHEGAVWMVRNSRVARFQQVGLSKRDRCGSWQLAEPINVS